LKGVAQQKLRPRIQNGVLVHFFIMIKSKMPIGSIEEPGLLLQQVNINGEAGVLHGADGGCDFESCYVVGDMMRTEGTPGGCAMISNMPGVIMTDYFTGIRTDGPGIFLSSSLIFFPCWRWGCWQRLQC